MKRKLNLRNNFHNSEVTLNVELDKIEEMETIELTANQVKKAQKALCGVKDCQCSGYLGTRGGLHEIDGQEVILSVEVWPTITATLTISKVGNY